MDAIKAFGTTCGKTLRLLAAASLCVAAADLAAAQTKAPANAPQFLFFQTAKNIAFKDGILTLKDVSPVTAFFSDRPDRIVGHVRNDIFLRQWSEGKNSFKSDPPNAVLSIFNEGARPSGAIVVLANPRTDGSNLLYDAQTLKGNLPATATESTLFIDGGGAPCDPQFDRGDPGYPCWAQQAFADR
jgi:hypothetical protein